MNVNDIWSKFLIDNNDLSNLLDQNEYESIAQNENSQNSSENESLDSLTARGTSEIEQNAEIDEDVSNGFKIEEKYVSSSKRFNCKQTVYKVSFPPNFKTYGDAVVEIRSLFEKLHNKFVNELISNKDRIRFAFNHSSLDQAIHTGFLKKKQLTSYEVLFGNFEFSVSFSDFDEK